jgi:hypothetical protein
MTYQIHPKEIESVVALPAPERYAHFISKCADWEEVWSLKNDEGFVSMSDDQGQPCIPFWPHPDYAKQHATGSWDDCKPIAIKLSDFTSWWVDGMEKDKIKAAIFPNTGEQGIIMEPGQVRKDIELECNQYK